MSRENIFLLQLAERGIKVIEMVGWQQWMRETQFPAGGISELVYAEPLAW